MLSNSHLVEVCFKAGGDLRVFSWFVKIPKSDQTASLDRTEAFMYNVMFPTLQKFANENFRGSTPIEMPIPLG